MVPPVAPMGAGAGGDTNRPRPGTAPPSGQGRPRPAAPTLGVPTGLRGRTAGRDARARQAAPRLRSDSSSSTELLDEELWKVDDSQATMPQRSSDRRADPRRTAY
jgi:hypothetical protein